MNLLLLLYRCLLLPCCHLLTLRKFMQVFLRYPRKTPVRYAVWAVYYILLAVTHLGISIPPTVLLLFNGVLVFTISTISYDSSLRSRCIFSILLIAVWMSVEVMISVAFSLMDMDGGRGMDIFGNAILYICMFTAAVVAGHCVKGEERPDLSIPYVAAVILIPAGSIYLMHHIFFIVAEHAEYSAFAICSSFVLLLMNYTAFAVYERMTGDASAQERSILYEQELELMSRQAAEREMHDKQICRMRHDMTNHLTGLLGMLRGGDSEQAEGYIHLLLKDSGEGPMQGISRSGNAVVDAIVNDKYGQAQREGIKFDANVFLPCDIPFHAGHLAIVFGNLLDNALEACREPGVLERWIRLEASYEKEVLMVVVNNSCSERKKDRYGRFSTTKKDRRSHGLGLSSVEQALEPYQGQLKATFHDGAFCAVVVMFGNHGEK